MRPSINRVSQRRTISVTGGNTFGLTKPLRPASSQAASTSAIGMILVSKCMPGHQSPEPGEIAAGEQVAEDCEVDHHGQHGGVGADAPVSKDQVTEAGFGGDEL